MEGVEVDAVGEDQLSVAERGCPQPEFDAAWRGRADPPSPAETASAASHSDCAADWPPPCG
jgi:hypothetical protein